MNNDRPTINNTVNRLSVPATVIAIQLQQLCKTQTELIVHAVQTDAFQLLTFLMFNTHTLRIHFFTNFEHLYTLSG